MAGKSEKQNDEILDRLHRHSPMTTGNTLAVASGGLVVVFWILPSILVALRADTEGFRSWTFFLLALTLSWPVVLALVSLLGRNSPLVATSRQRDDGGVTPIERGRRAS